jgi:transaldolase
MRTTAYLLPGLLLMLSICQSNCASSIQNHQAQDTVKTDSCKISEQIRTAAQKIAQDAVTNPGLLSNSVVKVDEHGNIQCYIFLNNFSDDNIKKLKSRLHKTEISYRKLKIIQGWISYKELDSVAEFDFVQSITQPEYGTSL